MTGTFGYGVSLNLTFHKFEIKADFVFSPYVD